MYDISNKVLYTSAYFRYFTANEVNTDANIVKIS